MRAALCLLLAGCQVAPPVRVERETFDVLTDVRAAMGTDVLFGLREGLTQAGTRTRPTADGGERVQPLVVAAHPSGDFLVTTGIGDDATTRGFDGEDTWTLDGKGVARSVGLGAREAMLLDGWLRTQLWLMPGGMGLEVEVSKRASDADVLVLEVQRPNAPTAAVVRIDRATMLPLEYVIERFGNERRVAFEEWSELDGLLLPSRVSEWHGGALVAVDRLERRTVGVPASFALPASRPSDVAFDAEMRPIDTRIDAGGRFYVRAEIDEQHSLWVLLDTGFGAHALSALAAERAGLVGEGTARLAGVGGDGTGRWVTAESVRIGALTLHSPSFATLDTAHLSARAGFQVDGVLGAPLFERAVVVLDSRAALASVHPPGRLAAAGTQLSWSGLALDGSAPCVQGRVKGSLFESPQLWFRLDTGSDDTLTVAHWAVDRFDLDADPTRLRSTALIGLFGEVTGWRAKLAAFEFAGLRRTGIDVTLLREDGIGPLSDPWIAGNLGMRALAGTRLVLDVGRRRVAVD